MSGASVGAGRSHQKPPSETPWTKKLWIYDLRTNHFTLETNPLERADPDAFVVLYHAANRHQRSSRTWRPCWRSSG